MDAAMQIELFTSTRPSRSEADLVTMTRTRPARFTTSGAEITGDKR